MRIFKVLLITLIVKFVEVLTYRILTIYAFDGKSHYLLFNELAKGLARKGHRVDMISQFPQEEKIDNLTQIVTLVKSPYGFFDKAKLSSIDKFNNDYRWMGKVTELICGHLDNPEVLNLVNNPPKDPPYDVVIITFPGSECFGVLGYLWNVPVVFVYTTWLYPWTHDYVGDPENVAISTNSLMKVPFEEYSFMWRFYSAYLFYSLKFQYLWRNKPYDSLIKKHWPNVPTLQELAKNTSLILVNSYFPAERMKPKAGNIIEIGGIHVPEIGGPKLDPVLKEFLDKSKNGIIYFSFGSLFRIESLPEDRLKIIFEALEKFTSMKVLLRIVEPEKLKIKLPSNFYHMPWLPQQKILKHPNTKLFITHSGLLGTQEAIYYGVPLLCIPFWFDQFKNANNYVAKKVALQIDFLTVTKEKLVHAIGELLYNPMYRDNMKKLSNIFKDRPANPIDTANYWIEFVIKHGKHSLRSPVMDLTWWQFALMDVFVTAIIGSLITIYLLKIILTKIFRSILKLANNHNFVYSLNKKKQT